MDFRKKFTALLPFRWRAAEALARRPFASLHPHSAPKIPISRVRKIRLLSTDFDGTLLSNASDLVFDLACMALIREL
jgi:hypothetical protein